MSCATGPRIAESPSVLRVYFKAECIEHDDPDAEDCVTDDPRTAAAKALSHLGDPILEPGLAHERTVWVRAYHLTTDPPTERDALPDYEPGMEWYRWTGVRRRVVLALSALLAPA